MKAQAFQHRRVNFLPADRRPSALGPGTLLALLAVAVLGVPLLGGGAKAARWGAERKLASLTAERDSLAAQVASGIQVRDSSADQMAVNSVKKALSEKVYWAAAFKELSNVAPKGIWLTAFDTSAVEGGKRVVIAGQGTSQAEVAEFFARLEGSYYFRDVQLKLTESVSDGAGQFQFQFEGKMFDEPKGGRNGAG